MAFGLNNKLKLIFYRYKQGLNVIKKHGLRVLISKIKKQYFDKLMYSYQAKLRLKGILSKHPNKPIIILTACIEWDTPLFQRPHHIAKKLAKQGFLYFFCTLNSSKAYKQANGFLKVAENCFATNHSNLLFQLDREKILHVYSTANTYHLSNKKSIKNVKLIVYEYIDEIHEDISGVPIPNAVIKSHDEIIRNEEILCITTASKLYEEVGKRRSKNFALITNGVELEHFQGNGKQAIPPEIVSVISKKQPVIGYFGAFAKWFDYALIKSLADSYPDYQIILIGFDYDGSIKQHDFLQQYTNIHVLGPIDYKTLPRYACWFDVAIIPFIINEITLSTSPVKLFEYMALGCSIVATDMPECKKYQSVLTSANHQEFIQNINKALQLKSNPDYLNILLKEAKENTWQSKAKQIAELINKNLKAKKQAII